MYHGKWLFYYPSGQLEEEENFADNRKQGLTTFYYENGKKRAEGNFVRDRENGLWTYWFENGNKQEEGLFDMGLRKDSWKSYYQDGRPATEVSYQDSLSSVISFWNETGEQLVKNGEGVYTTYYENERIASSGPIRNGRYDGAWSSWYENGTLKSQTIYHDGSPTLLNSWNQEAKVMVKDGKGYHKDFYNNGIVSFECGYQNGKLHGLSTTRNVDNIVTSEVTYVNGKYDGLYKLYNEEGHLSVEGNFKNNTQEGVWTWYHLNGQKEASAKFIHGRKDGEETFWSESGNIVKREFYKMDKLIKEELY